MSENNISIDAIFQKAGEGEEQVDVVILTHVTAEKNVNAAIKRIEALPTIPLPVVRIRLEDLLAGRRGGIFGPLRFHGHGQPVRPERRRHPLGGANQLGARRAGPVPTRNLEPCSTA